MNLNSNDDDSALRNPLTGFNDWSNLKFRAVDSPNAPGNTAREHGPDVTFAQVLAREANLAAFFSPDLAAAKAVDKPDAAPGDQLGYTIAVTNIGTGPATVVTAVDTLPDASTQSRSLANASPGDAQSFTINYTVPCNAPDLSVVTNSVSVSGRDAAGGPETKLANNAASVSTTIHAPVLTITKTASTPTRAGEAVRYRITVTNTGSGTASDVSLKDVLSSELYYSKALDLGAGPSPSTATVNPDASTTLSWVIGALGAGASSSVDYSARPSLLLRGGDSKANTATASATNSNGCVVAPVTAAASTSIIESPTVEKSLSHGHWKSHPEIRTDELRARVQATDQRFDLTPADGMLSNPEATTGLGGDNGVRNELKSRLLATLLNLANRAVNASTRVDSNQARALGIADVAQAVRFVQATLALDPETNKARYGDAKKVLNDIAGPT
jgi:uncharacterized repeat protein (TIGR01451 family)